MNLPYQVSLQYSDASNKGTIVYIYDAVGNKLEKRTNELPSTFNGSTASQNTLGISFQGGFLNLPAAHFNLREGRIFIKGARKSNERWLPLQARQALELQQYLQANKFKEGILLARLTRANASKRNVCNRVKHMMGQLQQLNPNIIR